MLIPKYSYLDISLLPRVWSGNCEIMAPDPESAYQRVADVHSYIVYIKSLNL